MAEDEHNKDDDDAPELEFDNGRGFPAKQLFYLGTRRPIHSKPATMQ
jgi:hypothetical protein